MSRQLGIAALGNHKQIAWCQRARAEASDLDIEPPLLEPEGDVQHQPEFERPAKGVAYEFEPTHRRTALQPHDAGPAWGQARASWSKAT